MYRNMLNELVAWKEAVDRQIGQKDNGQAMLLIKGAYGVGKTWIANDFGEAFYEATYNLDFTDNVWMREWLEEEHIPEEIDKQLIRILKIPELNSSILLIFDEIQVSPSLFSILSRYSKQRPALNIILIASWVGDLEEEAIAREKIEFTQLTLMPMTFEEFMTANKAQELCRIIEKEKVEGLNRDLRPIILDYLRAFFLTGGMPEVVLDYMRNKDWNRVDSILHRILQEQRTYILRYAPKKYTKKVLEIWDSIPSQLLKENKKFMYGVVDVRARAREYEPAVEWIVQSGMVRKIFKVREGIAPLIDQVDSKSFELYHLDHGLLRVMHMPQARELSIDDKLFNEMNGILAEQMVLAELTLNVCVNTLYFWNSGATARIDFIFEDDGEVIPVDVQATIRTKAQNLKVFRQKYGNRMAIRISLQDLEFEKGILNIPLYGLWNF